MSLPYRFKAKSIIKEGRTTETAVNKITQWLLATNKPSIPQELIVLFLLCCQNNITATQRTIEAYFKLRKGAPELFRNRDIDCDELKKAMNAITCCAVPRRIGDNIAIHIFNLLDTDYKKFDLVSNMKLTFMLNDASQRYNPPNRLIVVIDMKGSTFRHLTRVKLDAVKKFIGFMQEGMPMRLESIHVLNTDFIFDRALGIAKMFTKSDILSLVKPHKPKMTMAQFQQEWIPASHLPEDYEGELPSCRELNRRSIEQFREMKVFFQAEEQLVDVFCDHQTSMSQRK